MSKTRPIRVCFRLVGNPSFNRSTKTMKFTDWYDFADFIKQKTLNGYHVEIRSWVYA